MKNLYKNYPYSLPEKLSLLSTRINHLALSRYRLSIGLLAVVAFISFGAQAQTVTSLTLINSETNQDIRNLVAGETIDIRTLPTYKVNIRANTDPATVGSVAFDLNGKRMRVENQAPYTMFGDTTINSVLTHRAGSLKPGANTLTATPYTGTYALGTAGTPLTLSFNVIGHQVLGFTLVNADNEQDIGPVNEGTVIDLATLPTQNLNIRANTNSNLMGSVILTLRGMPRKIEHHSPYTFFGDTTLNRTVNYRGGTLPIGGHVLKAVPYSGTFGSGLKGDSVTISFSVRNGTITATPDDLLQQHQSFRFKTYPNPAHAVANISFSVGKPGRVTLDLFDLRGALVSRVFEDEAKVGQAYNVPVKTAALQNGIYICRMRSGSQSFTQRLVVIK
jgi:hypothetical protein